VEDDTPMVGEVSLARQIGGAEVVGREGGEQRGRRQACGPRAEPPKKRKEEV
jgi:hypothetical protein